MCSVPIRGVDSIGISKTNHKLGLSGLGYGKINPIHKTSITKSAITDQAGLSHISTDNLSSEDGQQALNPIISNDFTNQKSQLEKELGNQVMITTEFGREIPKQIGDYAQAKEIELLAQGNIEEAKKWAEGGVYRVALHTAMGALATGTAEGAISAGGVAYSAPKIDQYLEEQGFDKQTRDTTSLALSAGIGMTVDGDTASTVNNVGQVQWNYLSHQENERLRELRKEKSKLSNAYGNCVSQRCAEITREIKVLEDLSKQRDKAFDTAHANCRAGGNCNKFYYLHVIQRRDWNKDAERLFKANRSDWKLMEDYQNAFHNYNTNGVPEKLPNGNYRYKKFVHNNGQMEIIIDTKDGILSDDDYTRIVRDPTNAGTFNYYAPSDVSGHKLYDVNPYTNFGNGKGDKTTLSNRKNVMLHLPVPYTKYTFPIGTSGFWTGDLPGKTTNPKTMGANRITNNAERSFNASQVFCENNKEACNEK